jgi:lipopolysaccharide exporter
MQDKALRGVPWTLMSYSGSKLVSILTTLVLAHLIAPGDFGLLALATIATNFLYWIADSGFSGAVVVRQDFTPKALGTVLTMTALTGFAAAAIAVAVSPLAAVLFHDGRVTGVLIAISALLPLGSIAGFWEALLLRELLFRRRSFAVVGQALVTAAVSILLAVMGEGVWSLVIGQIAGYLALMVAFAAIAPFRVRPAFDRATARDTLAAGRGFLGQGMLMYIRLNVDTVTVGIAFGQRRLGYYSMANRFGDLVYWLIAHPIATVTFPSFAKSRHAGDDIRPQFLDVLRLVALVSCPVGIIMSAAAEPFTRALFGDRWLPMAGPLAIMGLWAAARQIDTTLQWLLNSVHQAGAMARLSALVLPPLILGCWLAASIGGLTAVALVPLGDTLLSAGLTGWLVRRHVAVGFGDQWRAVAPAIIASLPTWIVTWGIGQLVDPAAHAVLALMLSVLAGVITYFVSVWLIAPDVLRLTVAQARRMLGRRGAPIVPPSPVA